VRTLTIAVCAVLLTLGLTLSAAAEAPTTITVPTMDCAGCAKNVAARLKQVPGVASAQANLQAQTITVTPQQAQVLSPRALWEAVEKARHRPSRLEGPSGTFTAKAAS